jgi:hypothetical protein
MERDDLDRFLSDDEIVPSSGFVARVMDAVRVEAAAPPAIPFPWLRALPGIVAVVIALASMIAGFFALVGAVAESAVPPAATFVALPSGDLVAWLLVVVLLCTVPVALSLRITRGHL